MKERIRKNWLYALLSFCILTAAAPPFLTVYHLEHPFFFTGIIFLICLVTLLFKHFLITVPVYIVLYLTTLFVYFPMAQRPNSSWFQAFYQSLTDSHAQILSGELTYMPKTIALVIILFFIIALAILLIHYERLWLSYAMIISYHLILVVFNQIQLSWTILFITCVALLFHQLKSQPEYSGSLRRSKVLLLTAALLLTAVGSSYYLQQFFPEIRNFLFVQTASIRSYVNKQGLYKQINRYGTSTLSKSGFSDNDQQLGGPLLDDSTVLFTALQPAPHYWRVETKNSYTGKGWESFSESVQIDQEQQLFTLGDTDYYGPQSEERKITLTFKTAANYFPQPYGSSRVPLDSPVQLDYFDEKNRINLAPFPSTIELFWQENSYQEQDLQGIQAAPEEAELQDITLPSGLPERISTLSAALTQEEPDLYSKVKAVERYLKTEGGFRYSKIDTPFPPENQDYVDHFLFDSKVGYCDNFSTAMVILLRSVGIPSRWAKGFAPGELTGGYYSEYKEYTIQNSHAHSWPEVYFQGYGWLPFEPTPSFSNTEVTSESEEQHTSEQPIESQGSSSSESSPLEKDQTSSSTSAVNKEEQPEEQASFIKKHLQQILAVTAALLLLFSSWLFRRPLALLWFQAYRIIRPADFTGAYLQLLKAAEKNMDRAEDESLSGYAQRFEAAYPQLNGQFIHLTTLYEQIFYGKQAVQQRKSFELLDQTAKLLLLLK